MVLILDSNPDHVAQVRRKMVFFLKIKNQIRDSQFNKMPRIYQITEIGAPISELPSIISTMV